MATSIQKTSASYSQVSPPEFAWEQRDCVVRSLALASGRPYREVHALLREHGRKDRHGCSCRVWIPAAEELGFRLSPIVRSPTTSRRTGRCSFLYPTLTQWLRLNPRGTYAVTRRGHMFVVRDGIVFDWVSGTGPRSRIDCALRFVEA